MVEGSALTLLKYLHYFEFASEKLSFKKRYTRYFLRRAQPFLVMQDTYDDLLSIITIIGGNIVM